MLSQHQKKLTLICCIILAALGLMYGTVYVLCKIYLNPQKLKGLIVAQAQKQLNNRTVTVGDDIDLSVDWDMSPNLILHKVTISNPAWAANSQMLTIEQIDFNFSLRDLLFKKFIVNSIRLTKPVLYLESNAKQNNWDQLQNPSTTPSSIQLTISKIMVTDGKLIYNDEKFLFNNFDLTAYDENLNFHLHFNGSHGSVPFKGSIDIATVGRQFVLDIVNLQSGSSDLSGKLLITSSPVSITGEFNSDKFKFKDFTLAEANPNGEYTVPNAPLPIGKLHDAVFDVSLKVNTLELGGLDLKNVALNAKNDKNVLNINLNPAANVADGKFDFALTYDLNSQVPTLNLQAQTSTIQFSTVLEQMFGKTSITGSTLDFKANLQGQGRDLNSIVGSLNGQILIVAGPGQFLNSSAMLGNIFTNVLSSVITFNKQAPSTEFKCGVMNFKVTGGVANAKNGIGMEAASVNVLGNGMIDLRNGRIAFSLTPQNLSANPMDLSNFSMAQFVAVKGTLSKPEMTVSTAAIIREGANVAIAAGIAGSTGGIGGLIASGIAAKMAGGGNKPVVSPCQTALAAN